MLNDIVEQQKKLKQAMTGQVESEDAVRVIIKVPLNMVGLVIGKGGETIKYIAQV